MAATTYTRVLPNLTKATRRAAYKRIILLLEHLEAFDIDLLSITFDAPTRTVSITLTDPVPVDNIDHLDLR